MTGPLRYEDIVAVSDEFSELRSSIEKVHLQFRLHKWREPLIETAIVDDAFTALTPMARPSFSVPICPDLAAFTTDSVGIDSQEEITETQSGEWFDNKSLFFIRGETLGFAIPSGSIAIVDSQPYAGSDQNLVISIFGDAVFARRMLKSRYATGVSLSAEMPDPRTRRKTLTYDQGKLKIHKIVGVVFSNMSPPQGGHEATQVETAPELNRIEMAYRVREDSAVPLVLPGQVVLGGAKIKHEELDSWKGALVALTLTDGRSVLKRVGATLGGASAHLRQFETIGGQGASIVVATSLTEISHNFPVMSSARCVVGVMYDA